MSLPSRGLAKFDSSSEDIFQIMPGGSREEQIILLHLGKQCFGVPIVQVQDIVTPERVTLVPRAPEIVRGVLNLRGRIVTVLDLRVIFGHKKLPSIKNSISVSIEYEEDFYTLLIDRVGEVLRVPKEKILNVPRNLDNRLSHIATGIVQLKDGLVVVIDVPSLMNFVMHKDGDSGSYDQDWVNLMDV